MPCIGVRANTALDTSPIVLTMICPVMMYHENDDASTACQALRAHAPILAELYCGNGNFTIPLAANFRRVVATEVSKTSVEAAKYNAQASMLWIWKD